MSALRGPVLCGPSNRICDPAQCGFVPHRSRLHSVLHLKLLRWRARKAGRGSVVCFYDEINAFPSMSWPLLHKATCLTACDDDAALLVQRYEQALGIINDADGHSLLYRTQCGDRQGDGPASQRYILAQDPILR